jgi:purine-binding chemotaxis protein CheW
MEKQLVIFELGNGQYGIEIATVEGIVKMQEITKIPYAPSFVEGVTDLRGSVLPVMDLNKRFGLPAQEQTSETRIITVNMGTVKVGMIVSKVTEVLTIEDAVIEPPPAMVSSINTDFITGIAKISSRLVVLLDLDKVLNVDEQKAAAMLAAPVN